jgi:hypothetical protein
MADERDDNDKPLLQQSSPPFLGPMDRNPTETLARFYDFTWKLFLSHPPAIFLRFPRAVREDLIEQVIEKCCKDNFRNLRKYTDRGRPFAFWLYRVARNEAISYLRTLDAEKRRGRLMVVPEIVRPDQNLRKCEALKAVRECLGSLSRNHQEDMGLGSKDGKIVSEQLRQARKLLRKELKKRGVDLGVLDPVER